MSTNNSKPVTEELDTDFWSGIEGTVDEDQVLEDEQLKDVTIAEEEEKQKKEEDEEVSDEVSEEVDESITAEEEIDEEETEESEPEEELSLVNSIKQKLGYEIEEEFEDTEEGIQQLFEASKQKAVENALETYFDRYPDVKELVEYRELGGDPDKFFQTKFPEVDYQKVELKEDDTYQQEQLIKQELKNVRGYNDEEIEAELEDYRNGGILENKAKRALSALKVKQQEDQKNLIEEQRQQAAEQEQQIEQYWNNVKETIDKSNQLKGFSIPSKDKDPFFDYLSKPIQEGKSQAMIDHEKADLETKMAVDYLLYKGFKISDLISKKAQDLNAKTLRERLKGSKLNKKSEASDIRESYTEELGTI